MNNNQNNNNQFQADNNNFQNNLNSNQNSNIDNSSEYQYNNQTANYQNNQNQDAFYYDSNNTNNMQNNLNNNQDNNNFSNDNLNNNQDNNNFSNDNLINQQKKKKKKTIIIIAIVVGVILAIFAFRFILAMIATGPILNTLDNARVEVFITDGQSAISTAEFHYIINNFEGKKCFTLNTINQEMEKKLDTTPFGTTYSSSSYITIEKTIDGYKGSMCLVDEKGTGFPLTEESNITSDIVKENVTCTPPPECN